MIQTESEELQPDTKFDEVNIYQLIPEAKPVIQGDYSLEDSKQMNIPPASVLFKKKTKIEDGYMFSSFHESGNIESVTCEKYGIFNLRLSNDSNSNHQCQWFYFKTKGIKKGTFIISGFKKIDSLFNYGMKVCIKQQGQWRRGGTNISYFKNSLGQDFSLTFDHTFINSQTISEIAYCYPYTHSDLKNYLNKLLNNKKYQKIIKQEIITKTLLDNQIVSLTFCQQSTINYAKPIIFVTSRVHPGETVSSFILQGFIDYLLSDNQQAKLLLKYYQIRIIPMLNPDGVKIGNYRFSFAGRDLNRSWKYPSLKITPEIIKTKSYIEKLSRRIAMVIDIHGHSRKKDVFFYGCQPHREDRVVRQFPYMMAKLSSYFSFNKSCFTVQKHREGTARVALWNLLKIPYIYTIESSFCGKQLSENNFTIHDLENIGAKLVQGLSVFFSKNYSQDQSTGILQFRNQLDEQFRNENELFANEQDQGSDSNPSIGKLSDREIEQIINQLESKKQKNQVLLPTKSYSSRKTQRQSSNLAEPKSFRRRVNNSLKMKRNTIDIDSRQFLLKVNQQMRLEMEKQQQTKRFEIQQKQREAKNRLLNDLKNKIDINLSGLDFFKNYQKKRISTTIQPSSVIISKRNKSKNKNSVFGCSIMIEHDVPEPKNVEPQYLRLKNYTDRLQKSKRKPKGFMGYSQLLPNRIQPYKTTSLTVKPLKSYRNIVSLNQELNSRKY